MKTTLLLLLTGFLLSQASLIAQSQAPPKGEPTNAEEAAAKKAAAQKIVDGKYEELVATLPPDEQAWEKTLQENLGSFYLPIHKQQKVEGQSNAWDFVRDDPTLPRILLIGDSVSRGYTQATRRELAGKVNVHRAPANCGPSATGLKKLEVWLGARKWDVIHFNFGIHDRKTPISDYTDRLSRITDRLEATGATVVWATTTPIPEDWKEGPEIARGMDERNAVASQLMQERGILINDLCATITPHLKEVQNPADVHFTATGYDILAKQVASFLLKTTNQN